MIIENKYVNTLAQLMNKSTVILEQLQEDVAT
jgi:hypothetical protein